jgi:hypothetical protein
MTVSKVIEVDSISKTYKNEGLETEVLKGISISDDAYVIAFINGNGDSF